MDSADPGGIPASKISRKENFIRALNGEYTETIPVWMMRQAGRYMDEYQKIRSENSFERICTTPELAAQVTCMPVSKFHFDAAIIFSDILFVVEPFGFDLSYVPGPQIDPYLHDPSQDNMFVPYSASEKLGFVGRAIEASLKCLPDDFPMIGFCGAPFTVFCFLCGLKGAKDYSKAYRFMSNYPGQTARILQTITDISIDYLRMQIKAGANYVQVFDTFAGELSTYEFERWSRPYLQKIFDALEYTNVPRGLYIRNSNHLLEEISRMSFESFCLDWKSSLLDASKILEGKSLQGNLNPYMLLGPKQDVVEQTHRILNDMADVPGFIFNLGHGIPPAARIENVQAVVDTVHAFERKHGARISRKG